MRPSLNVVSDQLIVQILDESKRILSEIGIEVRGQALRQRLLDYGLKLDAAGDGFFFRRMSLSGRLMPAPSSFTLYNREGLPHAELGGDKVHFVPGSSGLKVLDHRTGKTRLANTADFVEYVRLADGSGAYRLPGHRLFHQR